MISSSITSVAEIIKGVSTALGIIGGLLGAYTFIDTYVLRFKPKFVTGDRVYLVYANNKADYTYLSSLVIQFEVFNHRNRLGRIEDVFVRIYDSRQLEASVLDLFPIASLAEMPISREDVVSAKRLPPATLAIPNRSSKTLILEMAQEKFSHGAMSSTAHLKLEALYKNPAGRWKRFARFSLHAEYGENSTHGEFSVHNFSLTDRFSEREKLKRRRIRLEVNSYKGITGLYLSRWIGRPYWFVKSKAMALPKGIGYLVFLGIAARNRLISECVEWPIARGKASEKHPFKMTFGNAVHARETTSFISGVKVQLRRKIDELNGRDSSSDKITITDSDREILVKKGGVQIKVYVGGDGFIGVIQSPLNSARGEMVFTVKIKQFPLGRFVWSLSGKPVFASTVATRVLDYLLLITSR
ncbi:hypothetical protein [Burkholderia sp. LMG 21824]|uniref:hypothetical protein n=1 Tax=Burkholderia sp. LMG 21824 TaxID=3158172 RepID=UPI003C30278B